MRRAWLAAALAVASVGSARADWTVKRDPFDATVVARYKAILARDPYDAGALAALKNLYGRYRTVAQFEQELADDWAGRVVRARMHPDAAHWKAVIEKREDARALFELGLYERAIAATTDVDIQRRSLERLLDEASRQQDSDKLDALFKRLSALTPKDPHMWIDRAHALISFERHADAVDAYAQAEKLFSNDRERQIDATFGRAKELVVIGEYDAAIAAFENVVARLPAGHYLADDARLELVDAHERRSTLPDYLAQIRRQFPHPGYKQWILLARIHDALGNDDAGVDALKHAIAVAPTEVDTQRELVERLDAREEGDAALAVLEAATRAIPGDFALHLDLAMRYRERKDTVKAVALMQKISARLRNDAGVHEKLIELFTEWKRPGLVLHEREELARLEPDVDHLVDLGDSYWASDEAKALATWKRIDDPQQLAQILIDHELYVDALAVYTRALAKDDKRAELWRARSDVRLTLSQWEGAEADARKAIELVSRAPMDSAHDIRYQLVRVLTQSAEHELWDDETNRMERAITEWNKRFFAIEPDLDAGYMLAELYGRNAPSDELLRVLMQLRTLVPTDAGVVKALVRAYKVLHRYDDAMAELRGLEKQDPTRKDIAEQIADLESRRQEQLNGWRNEGIEDPERDIYMRFHRERVSDLRGGVRIGLGTGLRGPADQSLSIGLFLAKRIAPHLAFVGRFDWTDRAGNMDSFSALAVSTGVAVPIGGTAHTTFFLGAAHRTEIRLGDHRGWDTLGLAGDLTLEVVPDKVPASFGLRFEQGVSDHGQGTALLLELTASSGT